MDPDAPQSDADKINLILAKVSTIETDVATVRRRQRGVLRRVREIEAVMVGTIKGHPGVHDRIRALEKWRAAIIAVGGSSVLLLIQAAWEWLTNRQPNP